MTTATLPRRIMRPVATPPARRSMLVGFLATLGLGLLLLAGTSMAIGVSSQDRVLSGVRIADVELGGLTRAEAEARLVAELPAVDAGAATIVAGEVEETVSFADLGRRYELDAMLDAALGVGRNGGAIPDGVARLRSLVRQASLPILVHTFDAEALDAAAERVAGAVSIHPVEAHVEHDGFAVRASEDVRLLQADAVRTAIASALDTTSPEDVRLELAVATVEPVVTTEEAEAAAEAAAATVADLELTIPGAPEDEEPLGISADTVAGWITFGPLGADDYAMRIDAAAAATAVAALAEDVDRDAVSARFGVAGAGLGGIIPGQDGR